MSSARLSATFSLTSVVRGYPVYKDYWEAATGETLRCSEERTNIHDPFAVTIIKGDSVVGHVPQKFPQSVHCFCEVEVPLPVKSQVIENIHMICLRAEWRFHVF